VAAVDRRVAVEEAIPGTGLVAASFAAPRFYTALLSLFAAVALALTAVGLFGVLSHTVQARTREIGVRVALGADRWNLRRLVLTQALLPAVAGLAAGLALSVLAAHVLVSLLFEVRPGDVATRAAVALVLLVTALLAGWMPASRATRIDPMRALRTD
jgi:putative ABC transport system permease protein